MHSNTHSNIQGYMVSCMSSLLFQLLCFLLSAVVLSCCRVLTYPPPQSQQVPASPQRRPPCSPRHPPPRCLRRLHHLHCPCCRPPCPLPIVPAGAGAEAGGRTIARPRETKREGRGHSNRMSRRPQPHTHPHCPLLPPPLADPMAGTGSHRHPP